MSDEQRILADGVLSEAREEAERIQSDWREARDNRRAALDRRIAALANETDELIARERDRIAAVTKADIDNQRRREKLRLRDAIHRDVELRAGEALGALAEKPEYREVLLRWTVEAGVGLAAHEAVCNCEAERRPLLEELLPEAAERIAKHLGHAVSLTMSGADPFVGQGVVLISSDGRTGFSNRVTDRVRRRQNRIRRIVHDSLAGEDENG